MNDLELGHRAALPFKIAVSAPVFNAVHLAVVIPDGLFTHGEDCFIEEFFPGVPACFSCKVDEASFAAPPAAVIVAFAVRRLDERVSLLVEVCIRMILQNTGLQIADHVDAARRHPVEELLRVREAFVIPVEGIAKVVLFSGGIPGREPEVVDRNIFFLVLVDDTVDFLVAVLFELGVVHGGRAVAERLLGRQHGSAGQPGVVFDDVADCFTGHQEQIDITAVRLIVAVAVPVAADFLPHIEDAVI